MRHFSIKALKIFSTVWGCLIALVIFVGNLMIVLEAPSIWAGIKEVQASMSPYNVGYYIVTFILISPSFGAYVLAGKLEKKEALRKRQQGLSA